MNHNIAETLPNIAAIYPDRNGLVCKKGKGYRSWTFIEIDSLTNWFARNLSDRGVTKGDRVILMVTPSVEFITLTFALFKIGAVIILIDPGMGYKNLLKCIGKVKPDGQYQIIWRSPDNINGDPWYGETGRSSW